ncbi:MAG: hypothetical protein ACTSR8_04960 [Promethearchaeota archaeon]
MFQNDLKDLLIEEYHSIAEKKPNIDPAIKKFFSFFKLNRKHGLNVISVDIN